VRHLGVRVLATLLLVGCSGGQAAGAKPSPELSSPRAVPTSPVDFESFAGAYRAVDATTYVINGLGHLVRLSDGWIRQLNPTAAANHFFVGSAFMVASPKEADVTFRVAGGRADQLTIKWPAQPAISADRLTFKETSVKVPAQGAELAATVTEPSTPGPHPGIVVVHGSERGTRILYGVWVGFYASLGFAVLSYDKRGAGDSTGEFPGEYASTAALSTYADDAVACLRTLSAWPGVDPKRVGFHGGSQGGWTVPLAMQRFPAAAFAVLVSGPAVSVDQQGTWQGYTGGSHHLPTAPESEIDGALRSPGSGYNPMAVLQAIDKPILWLNGELDGQVPTTLNTEILRSLGKANFDIQLLPRAGHSLLETGTGLVVDDDKATRLAHDLFIRISAWLAFRMSTARVEGLS